MPEPIRFWDAVEAIREEDDRYAPEAYAMVMDVLEFTIRSLEERRHLTATEVLDGLRRYCGERYGIMAWTVLERWGIRATGDVGDIVFHLVQAGVLSSREEDRREDFDDAFSLYDALERDYFNDAAAE